MASIAAPLPKATSFVYEDLVLAVITIQNQLNQANHIIEERSSNDRNAQRQLACRSFVFIDPFGNRIEEQFADHWTIGKVVKKFHKNMCPKYLQSWIRIGLFVDGEIQNLTATNLSNCVSQYLHGQEFIAYGEISLTLLNEGCQLLGECSLIVVLNEEREELANKVLSLRELTQSHLEVAKDIITLKVCPPDTRMKHYDDRWMKGADFQSGDTIFSARLYKPDSSIIAKHAGIKAYLAGPIVQQQIFVRTLHGRSITIVVDLDQTIQEAKRRIEEEEKIPVDCQRLIYRGKQLEDNLTFTYYHMAKESTVNLVLRLRGGMYHFTSGRNDFDRLGLDCVKAIEKILHFKSKTADISRSTPLEKLQEFSINAQPLLSSLYSSVQPYPKIVDALDLRDVISVPIDDEVTQVVATTADTFPFEDTSVLN